MIKYFLDSNICIYAFSTFDVSKQNVALALMANHFVISPQVIIETYNALKRKKIVDPTNLDTIVTMFLNTATVQAIDHGVITNALLFKHKYQLSFLDSIIVASAIQSNSSILYSEDMHHGLVIEEILSIINPFV